MTTIKPSARLARVKRVFDPYQDRKEFVRLDRNEDPAGWSAEHFEAFRRGLSPYDLAAYADSTEFTGKLVRWLGVAADSVLVTSGSDAAMKSIFETYVDPGDLVLMQDPSWRMYEVYNDIYQGQALLVPYDHNLGFDAGAVLKAVNDRRLRLVILANPNQPTGTLMEDAAIEAIVAAAAAVGTIVVIDEAYHLFTPNTALGLIARYDNLIVVRTFSKAFGLAGLRLGYCVAQAQRIGELSLLRPVTDSNSIALKCGGYALDHLDWVLARIAGFIEGREFLHRAMTRAGLETYPSHTNFLLVRCPSMSAGRALISEARRRNYLLKGPWSAPPLQNCVRVSVGPLELMTRFWSDCEDILLQHAARQCA
jgi:histidinol-phosphate aminotransferase